MFRLKNIMLTLSVISLFCSGAHSEIYSAEVADLPTKTNQLKTIALFPLISPTKEKTTLFENKAYFRKLQARCGNILVNQSEEEWAANSRKIPDRHDLLRFGRNLNSDGVLVSYPEDGATISVLLNTRENTVWVKKHKPAQWLNLCKEIKKGNAFEELPVDRGGSVAVLRVVDSSGNEKISEIWRTAIEDKFKKRGYKIVDSNQVPDPKSFVAVATSTGIYAPSGIELGGSPKVIERMEINISSVAATIGVDWVVIGTSESTVSENIGVYNKIAVSGRVEVYTRNGELSESYRIYRLIESGGVHVVVVAANLLDAVIGNSGKIYDAVYSGVKIPTYW